VNVYVALVELLRIDPELVRLRLHETQRRLGTLLHDIAELPRQDELATARQLGRLDEQDVATDGRPGEFRLRLQAPRYAAPPSFSKRVGPRISGTSAASIVTVVVFPSAIRIAARRNNAPISRSRFRQPIRGCTHGSPA